MRRSTKDAAEPDRRQGRRALLVRGALLAGSIGLAVRPARAQRRGPLGVLATTGMIGDLVREIGGDRIRLEVLMGPGVDPHLYKATRDDIAKMLRADLAFYNGLLLEGKMSDAFIRVARSGKPVHAVTELLPEDQLIEPEGAEGHYDPHVWMDPRRWSRAAVLIAERLIVQDQAGAPAYHRNLAALQERIRRLGPARRRRRGGAAPRQRFTRRGSSERAAD